MSITVIPEQERIDLVGVILQSFAITKGVVFPPGTVISRFVTPREDYQYGIEIAHSAPGVRNSVIRTYFNFSKTCYFPVIGEYRVENISRINGIKDFTYIGFALFPPALFPILSKAKHIALDDDPLTTPTEPPTPVAPVITSLMSSLSTGSGNSVITAIMDWIQVLPDPNSYQVFVSKNTTFGNTPLVTNLAGVLRTLTFTVPDLGWESPTGRRVYVKIKAIFGQQGLDSNVVNVLIADEVVEPPAPTLVAPVVTSLTTSLDVSSSNSIITAILNWSQTLPNPNTYRIFLSKDSTFSMTPSFTGIAGSLRTRTFTVPNLGWTNPSNRRVYVKLEALFDSQTLTANIVNALIQDAPVVPPAPTPIAPVFLSLETSVAGSVITAIAQWSQVAPAADSYQIFLSDTASFSSTPDILNISGSSLTRTFTVPDLGWNPVINRRLYAKIVGVFGSSLLASNVLDASIANQSQILLTGIRVIPYQYSSWLNSGFGGALINAPLLQKGPAVFPIDGSPIEIWAGDKIGLTIFADYSDNTSQEITNFINYQNVLLDNASLAHGYTNNIFDQPYVLTGIMSNLNNGIANVVINYNGISSSGLSVKTRYLEATIVSSDNPPSDHGIEDEDIYSYLAFNATMHVTLKGIQHPEGNEFTIDNAVYNWFNQSQFSAYYSIDENGLVTNIFGAGEFQVNSDRNANIQAASELELMKFNYLSEPLNLVLESRPLVLISSFETELDNGNIVSTLTWQQFGPNPSRYKIYLSKTNVFTSTPLFGNLSDTLRTLTFNVPDLGWTSNIDRPLYVKLEANYSPVTSYFRFANTVIDNEPVVVDKPFKIKTSSPNAVMWTSGPDLSSLINTQYDTQEEVVSAIVALVPIGQSATHVGGFFTGNWISAVIILQDGIIDSTGTQESLYQGFGYGFINRTDNTGFEGGRSLMIQLDNFGNPLNYDIDTTNIVYTPNVYVTGPFANRFAPVIDTVNTKTTVTTTSAMLNVQWTLPPGSDEPDSYTVTYQVKSTAASGPLRTSEILPSSSTSVNFDISNERWSNLGGFRGFTGSNSGQIDVIVIANYGSTPVASTPAVVNTEPRIIVRGWAADQRFEDNIDFSYLVGRTFLLDSASFFDNVFNCHSDTLRTVMLQAVPEGDPAGSTEYIYETIYTIGGKNNIGGNTGAGNGGFTDGNPTDGRVTTGGSVVYGYSPLSAVTDTSNLSFIKRVFVGIETNRNTINDVDENSNPAIIAAPNIIVEVI